MNMTWKELAIHILNMPAERMSDNVSIKDPEGDFLTINAMDVVAPDSEESGTLDIGHYYIHFTGDGLEIPTDFLEMCSDIYIDHFFADLSHEEIRSILIKEENLPKLRRELVMNSPHDTDCRDWLSSILCEDLGTNEEWPSIGKCNEDPTAYERFMYDYFQKLTSKYAAVMPDADILEVLVDRDPRFVDLFHRPN